MICMCYSLKERVASHIIFFLTFAEVVAYVNAFIIVYSKSMRQCRFNSHQNKENSQSSHIFLNV